jgi:methionyl-tRNA synthetase
MDKFYVTTAIPYVNAAPHIGHALEFVQADALARIQRLLIGDDNVRLLSGGDENALKNVQAAEKAGKPIREFIDDNAALFRDLAVRLNVKFDVFQKGSDQKTHYPASQKLWTLCDKTGDIYKKEYEGLYCVGCEAFYTEDELNENGECYEHPGKKLELVRESNYFFRLSKYQEKLVELISTDTVRIVPEFRKNEVLSFLKQPLTDISISRTNERAKNWGVPVPGDDTQRIYVWFDALNIYQSGVGFGWDEGQYKRWWPADIHVIGKGITRFHAVYWPAFLLSAGLPLPKTIFVHGYFTVNGQKISKTLGNVIDPVDLINRFGAEALRYYFLREIPPFADGDFSEKRFVEVYNADLANGIGNLAARVARLASQCDAQLPDFPQPAYRSAIAGTAPEYAKGIDDLNPQQMIETVINKARLADRELDRTEPWKLKGIEQAQAVTPVLAAVLDIAILLAPFLPETSEKILTHFAKRPFTPLPPIFPRIKPA